LVIGYWLLVMRSILRIGYWKQHAIRALCYKLPALKLVMNFYNANPKH
jgi:hypothetical protein